MDVFMPREFGWMIGRTILKTDVTEVNAGNVLQVLNKALIDHAQNRAQIQYLWDYYRGKQPVLDRIKEVRPEICNKIVENRANEIVSFKTGYLMGEPIQYVSRDTDETLAENVNQLNEYVFAEEKATKDMELADWMHICGTSYRMILPDTVVGEKDDSPFEIYTMDPRNTLVVYTTALGNKSVLGVHYVTDDSGNVHYSCYTDREYFDIVSGTAYGDGTIISVVPHIIGGIPIVEYPLNKERQGAFEIVLPILDAINLADSNRLDGLEQFIQALMVFYNVDIDSDQFKELRAQGALKVTDTDPQIKGRVEYLINNLSQGETQTLKDDMYQTVLEICGMPNRNGGSSTSDTGSAVILRDGWSAAETRAKKSELMFKKSERLMLKMMLNICRVKRNMELKVSDIEIRFTRRNYENIVQKAQVLDLMLKNPKIHPQLAFSHSGMFVDSELAYTKSEKYYNELLEDAKNEVSETDSGDGGDDRVPVKTGESS